MALTKTTVSGTITLPDGTAPGSVLEFILSGFDTDGQIVDNGPVQATVDAAGAFSIALWPNTRGPRGTSYIVRLLGVVDGRPTVRSFGSIAVPDTGTAVLSPLLASPIPPGLAAAVILTQAAYDALTPDANTLYLIAG